MTTRSKTKRSTKRKARASRAPVGRAAAAQPKFAAEAAPNMADENWDALVSDFDVLGGRCASNAVERHVTLDHAVTNVWAAEDIDTIRRVESNGRCQWVMWRR